jgi:hypothetical protein
MRGNDAKRKSISRIECKKNEEHDEKASVDFRRGTFQIVRASALSLARLYRREIMLQRRVALGLHSRAHLDASPLRLEAIRNGAHFKSIRCGLRVPTRVTWLSKLPSPSVLNGRSMCYPLAVRGVEWAES